VDGHRVAFLALVACGRASAGPPAPAPALGITPPADWKDLPTVADAATQAAKAVLGGAAAISAAAWGQPSRGCYLAAVAASGTKQDTLDELEKELRTAVGAGVSIGDWNVSPGGVDHEEIAATFTAATASAKLRGLVALDAQKFPHVAAAACFHNDREPAACESACAPLLAQLAPP